MLKQYSGMYVVMYACAFKECGVSTTWTCLAAGSDVCVFFSVRHRHIRSSLVGAENSLVAPDTQNQKRDTVELCMGNAHEKQRFHRYPADYADYKVIVSLHPPRSKQYFGRLRRG